MLIGAQFHSILHTSKVIVITTPVEMAENHHNALGANVPPPGLAMPQEQAANQGR